MQQSSKSDVALGALRSALRRSAGSLARHPGDALSLLYSQLVLNGSEAAHQARERLVDGERPLLRLSDQRDLSVAGVTAVIDSGGGPLTMLAALPDHRGMLVGGGDGAVSVWRPGDTSLAGLTWLSTGVLAIHPAVDDSPSLLITDDGMVQLLDAEGGIVYTSVSEDGEAPTAAAVLPQNRGFVLGHPDGRVVVTGPEGDPRELLGHAAAVRICQALGKGERLLTASDDCTLRIWNTESGQLEKRLVGHSAAITACDCHAGAGLLLSGDADGGLRLWDCDGRDVGHLPGHQAAVSGCRLSRNGREAVSVSLDGMLRRWDRETSSELGRWHQHDGGVVGLVPLVGDFDREAKRSGTGGPGQVVTWGNESVVRVRELATGRERLAYRPRRGRLQAVAVFDGQVVIATSAGTLEVVEPADDDAPGVTDRSGEWASFAVDPDAGARVALHRGQVVEWSVSPEREPRLFPMGNSPDLFFCRRLSDRRGFVMLGEGGLVNVLVTNQSGSAPFEARSLDLGGRRPSAAAVTESAWSVNPCFGFDSGEVMVAVLPDAEQEAPAPWDLRAHPSAVTTLAVDGSQGVLLTGHADGACLLFNVDTGERINRFQNLPQAVTASVALSGNGFLVGCANGQLHWWRLDSTKPLFVTHEHDGAVNDCAAGGGAGWAVTAGDDATLRFWSLDDGRCVETFHGDAPFTALQLDESGSRLWALDRSGVLRTFDIRPWNAGEGLKTK